MVGHGSYKREMLAKKFGERDNDTVVQLVMDYLPYRVGLGSPLQVDQA